MEGEARSSGPDMGKLEMKGEEARSSGAALETWHTVDTEYSACSVEVQGQLLATGTYQVYIGLWMGSCGSSVFRFSN